MIDNFGDQASCSYYGMSEKCSQAVDQRLDHEGNPIILPPLLSILQTDQQNINM